MAAAELGWELAGGLTNDLELPFNGALRFGIFSILLQGKTGRKLQNVIAGSPHILEV